MPQFAVEFYGPGHSTIHDAKKDELSRRDNLALFRVDLRSSQDRSGDRYLFLLREPTKRRPRSLGGSLAPEPQ